MAEEADPMTRLQERVASLERELVETKLRLACARSSEDQLKLELKQTSSALAAATSGDGAASSRQGGALPDFADEIFQSRSNLLAVSTADPFSRKKVHRARRPAAKQVLNPGSCSSALNLLALASQGSVQSLRRAAAATSAVPDSSVRDLFTLAAAGGSASSLRRSRPRLNPGSCASGIDLLAMTLPAPPSSAQGQGVRDQGHLLQRGREGREFSDPHLAALLGGARILSSSSFHRNGSRSSRNAMRMNNASQQGGSNRNAEWEFFE